MEKIQNKKKSFSNENLKVLNNFLQLNLNKSQPSHKKWKESAVSTRLSTLKIRPFRPSLKQCKELAVSTGLTNDQIRKWIKRQQSKIEKNSKSIVNNILILKNHFSYVDRFPDKKQRLELAKLTSMSQQDISRWFSNQRIAARKTIIESQLIGKYPSENFYRLWQEREIKRK